MSTNNVSTIAEANQILDNALKSSPRSFSPVISFYGTSNFCLDENVVSATPIPLAFGDRRSDETRGKNPSRDFPYSSGGFYVFTTYIAESRVVSRRHMAVSGFAPVGITCAASRAALPASTRARAAWSSRRSVGTGDESRTGAGRARRVRVLEDEITRCPAGTRRVSPG